MVRATYENNSNTLHVLAGDNALCGRSCDDHRARVSWVRFGVVDERTYAGQQNLDVCRPCVKAADELRSERAQIAYGGAATLCPSELHDGCRAALQAFEGG